MIDLRTFVISQWQACNLRHIAQKKELTLPRMSEYSTPVFILYLKYGIIRVEADVKKLASLVLLAALCAESSERSEHLNMEQLRADPTKIGQKVVKWIAYPYYPQGEDGNEPREWLNWPTLGDWMFKNEYAIPRLLLELMCRK